MRFVLSVFLVATLSASAQDAATMAAQQMQQDMQMQAAQQANQQAIDAAQNLGGGVAPAAKPSFSAKPGTYSAPITLRLTSRSRRSVIYYTTDGWTPTTLSARYTGPITLNATTNLQAIAIAPSASRSKIAAGLYVLPNTTPATLQKQILAPGSAIDLTFTKPVTTQGLQVGDTLPVALAEDLYSGNTLVAPKLTPVLVTVTQVDGPGRAGLPASLSFAAHSLTVNGRTIPLSGNETKEGVPHLRGAGFPIAAYFIKGGDAEIPTGATFPATVANEPLISSTR